MSSLNKMMLIGRLGQDPEKRTTATGKSVVKVSIAATDRYTDKSGTKREITEWVRVVFWGKLADLISQYCQKGSLVFVEGSLRTSEWTDKDSIKRYTTEVNAMTLRFLDSKQRSENMRDQQGSSFSQEPASPSSAPSAGKQVEPDDNSDDFIEDDIPF
ncbi:MAG: single-stranded DNA-binding protein [SAR324 cluster bacterium]|nr:single-stranded DNA-binding protein [SAR324 cluster bacterium]